MKVKFYAYLRESLGSEDQFECNCSTAEELFLELLKRYPVLKEERKRYEESGLDLGVLINGRDWRHLKEINSAEVKVSVFPPAAGG
ncbi:MoaD/ThiS family protein [Ignicoccus islandicus]|uniref:MoaD/ThiS family protein n=1 Tax=Ignicoccus islandicus TaxID=54259 RepID=UPI001F331D15|nr:MoaD/ThiS family protein [Ignicoccus islandicus]